MVHVTLTSRTIIFLLRMMVVEEVLLSLECGFPESLVYFFQESIVVDRRDTNVCGEARRWRL